MIENLTPFYPLVKQTIEAMGIPKLSKDEPKDEPLKTAWRIIDLKNKHLSKEAQKEFEIFEGFFYLILVNILRTKKLVKEIIKILTEYIGVDEE